MSAPMPCSSTELGRLGTILSHQDTSSVTVLITRGQMQEFGRIGTQASRGSNRLCFDTRVYGPGLSQHASVPEQLKMSHLLLSRQQ